jgi:hypothetical protein
MAEPLPLVLLDYTARALQLLVNFYAILLRRWC